MDLMIVATVHAVVGILILPVGLSLFGTQYTWTDVVLASVGAAIITLIPTIGEPASLLVMIAILYWRVNADLFPDIFVAVAAARLAMVPALMSVN